MRWDTRYPDPDELKREVEHVEAAIVESLLETLPENSIIGVYAKGSAVKYWETPIDYVPEISDLDVHISLTDESLIDRYFRTIERAIRFQESVESRYLSLKRDPIHVPRPQMLFLNDLEKMEGHLPSPPKSVKVLYGEGYPKADYSDEDGIRAFMAKDIEKHREFMEGYPHQIFDKLSKYNFQSLRLINWRVGPSGPKVLILHGMPIEESWTLNRTGIVSRLRSIGLGDFANAYQEYYLQSWDYFLSNWRDGDASRRAIENGFFVVEQFLSIVERWRCVNLIP